LKESYSQLIDEVKYILEKALEKTRTKINNIEFRLKDFDSFYAKIIRKDYGGAPFDLIEDIAGIRIICLYRSDLEKIEDVIKKNFRVLSSKTIRDTPLTFGYLSDHYIVCIPDKYTGIRYDSIKCLKCEIQVRTVSMHAWATVSHQLDYKLKPTFPPNLKTIFTP
jgi:putative GTP pyrophosphokinase